jgi:hypothetical protein
MGVAIICLLTGSSSRRLHYIRRFQCNRFYDGTCAIKRGIAEVFGGDVGI